MKTLKVKGFLENKMSLNASLPLLIQSLEKMLKDIEDIGQQGKISPDEIRKIKAQKMAHAIHMYVTSAVVTTSGSGPVVGAAGTIPVLGVAAPVASTGVLA